MSQIIGNPNRGTTGIMLDIPPSGVGQITILTGVGDPNLANDAADSTAGVNSAGIGSLYLRQDGSTTTTLYVKTALPNTWTAK
jgi:hypothetical protein